jgi:hypothetical protein
LAYICNLPENAILRTTPVGIESELSGLAIITLESEKTQDIICKNVNNRRFLGGMAKAVKIRREDISFEFGNFLSKFYGVSSFNFKQNVNSHFREAMENGILAFGMPLMSLKKECATRPQGYQNGPERREFYDENKNQRRYRKGFSDDRVLKRRGEGVSYEVHQKISKKEAGEIDDRDNLY